MQGCWRNFAKFCYLLNFPYKMTTELTFENFLLTLLLFSAEPASIFVSKDIPIVMFYSKLKSGLTFEKF